MNLTDILQREQIIPELRATDRWEAIDELVGMLVATGKVEAADREAIAAGVKRREKCMSTGIAFGVGVPTGSTELLDTFAAAFGRSAKGIEFDALDKEPVHVVLLTLVPAKRHQQYLLTTANLARLLFHAPFREALKVAPDVDAIYSAMCEHWRNVCGGFKKADCIALSNSGGPRSQ